MAALQPITYTLSAPIITHKGETKSFRVNPPKAKSFFDHGEPFTVHQFINNDGTQSIQTKLKTAVCFKFLADMTEIDEIDLIDMQAHDAMALFNIMLVYLTKNQPPENIAVTAELHPITYKLSDPIEADGKKISEITVKPPTGRSIINGIPYTANRSDSGDTQELSVTYDMPTCFRFLEDMTGLPESQLYNLTGYDLKQLCRALFDYTTGNPPTFKA